MQDLISLKSEIKKGLIDDFDTIKSELDIIGQQLLHKLNLEIEPEKHSNVLAVYKEMMSMIDLIFNSTMNDVSSYFSILEKNEQGTNSTMQSKEQILKSSLKDHLLYFKPDSLSKEYRKLDSIGLGILFHFRFYLNVNEMNFIRYLLNFFTL